MDNLIEYIKKYWLKWESLPFVFLFIVVPYFGIASEANGWFNIVMTGTQYLLLAIPFAVLFIVYAVSCGVHGHNEKKRAAQSAVGAPQGEKSESKTIWTVSAICAVVLVGVLVVLLLIANNGHQDGRYVLWADEYHVALTPTVVNEHYLKGEVVGVRGDQLTDYASHCVVELDFGDDETFTITYNGKLLGLTPGYNGVGYAESCTSTLWQLEEVEDGVYYVRNVKEDAYLKWYDDKNNWTSYGDILDKYEDEYRIRLEMVK